MRARWGVATMCRGGAATRAGVFGCVSVGVMRSASLRGWPDASTVRGGTSGTVRTNFVLNMHDMPGVYPTHPPSDSVRPQAPRQASPWHCYTPTTAPPDGRANANRPPSEFRQRRLRMRREAPVLVHVAHEEPPLQCLQLLDLVGRQVDLVSLEVLLHP